MASNATSSYIDLDKLTASEFSPYAYANSLVLSTNNPSDPSIDLTTPLSRVLFDLQEIDSNIDTLTSRSALDIIKYTSTQNAAAAQILTRVEEERTRLNSSYARLEKEVLGQYKVATEARLHAERSHEVLRLARNVQRILAITRQFEATLTDSGLGGPQGRMGKEDHELLLRATTILLTFRDIVTSKESSEVVKVDLIRTIRGRVFEDGEARILDYSRRIVREFSVSSLTSTAGPTFKDSEDLRARFTSAVHILYLLSPMSKADGGRMRVEAFEPELLLRSLQAYLQTAITSSSAGIARALGQLPTLERALMEVSARCQNIIAFEVLLKSLAPPSYPLLQKDQKIQAMINEDEENDIELADAKDNTNLLNPLLTSLDTASLPSYFWRSLASSLTTKVQEIMYRGGVSARTLKSNKDIVRNEIRECVLRGSKLPASSITPGGRENDTTIGNWEREAAVMVGSVIGPLGR